MEILEKIDTLRKERNWTVNKLAEEALLTQSTVANMFKRKTMPTIITLKHLCNAFGISLAQFFNNGEIKQVITKEENELLKSFRKLKSEQKQAVVTIIKNI